MKNFLLILALIVCLLPSVARCELVEDNHLKQGHSYLAEGRYNEAISEYKKAIKIAPNNIDAYHNIGFAYECLGKYQNAIEYYEKVLQITPDDAMTNYNMGVAYGNLGKRKEAIKYYEKTIQIDPNHVDAYNNLGSVYTELGEHIKAIQYCEKALAIDPNNDYAYINIACAKAGLNQYQEAVNYLQKALEFNPNSIKAYNNLGIAFTKLRQQQKAKENYQIADRLSKISASPNHILVTEFSKRVASMGLSILPPRETGCCMIKNSPFGGINYTKMTDDPMHTFGYHMLVVPIDQDFKNPAELLEWVKQNHQKDTDPKRFKNEKYTYNLNKRYDSYCVEYKVTGTDTKLKTRDGTNLILKMYGYIFINPKVSRHVVNIFYSERGVDEDFTQAFQKSGNEFIDSLMIEE
jgi:tetratricopeptide (TPR) repeat protein